MKKKFSYLLIILVLTSCEYRVAKSPQDLLVGSWQFNNVIYESEISPEIKPIIEAQMAVMRQTFSVDYLENKTYHSHSLKYEKGEWQLSEDSKILVHFFKEGEQKYKVLKLTNDSLFLKTTLQGQTLTLQFVRKK